MSIPEAREDQRQEAAGEGSPALDSVVAEAAEAD